MKQKEIAKKVGISPAFLSEILTGRKSPSWETAKKLAVVTGVAAARWMETKKKKIEID